MEITIIVALITALAAVIAPTISNLVTTIINNKHALEMQRIELIQKRRIQVIETYVDSVSYYIVTNQIRNWEEFSTITSQIFLYTPEEIWPQIKEINRLVNDGDHTFIESKFSILCQSLTTCLIF